MKLEEEHVLSVIYVMEMIQKHVPARKQIVVSKIYVTGINQQNTNYAHSFDYITLIEGVDRWIHHSSCNPKIVDSSPAVCGQLVSLNKALL